MSANDGSAVAGSAVAVGIELVALCNAGKGLEAVDTLYDEKIVSIEGASGEGFSQRMEGIDAIRGKNTWWYENHEVHSSGATGPFVGHREDQFAVIFETDVTAKATGERTTLREIGLYTVSDGKVVQEEFLYAAP